MVKVCNDSIGYGAETGGIFLLLKKIFGRPALRQNIMLVLYGLAGLGLFLKGWFDTVLLQWATINFMLFFLLADVLSQEI